MAQIIVRDDSPETSEYVTLVGDGVVKATVSDQRLREWTHFIRKHRDEFSSGPYSSKWGRGAARDATEAESFAIGQLTYLEAKTQLRQYAPRRYQELLGACIDYSAGPWAKSVSYKVKDQVGIGRRIAPGATDMPMVDQSYTLVNVPVELGGIGYSYTVEDIVTSAHLGIPLTEDLQFDSIQAYYNHMNVVALQGELNFKGFYANSGVTAANRASGAVWDAATGDTIVSDVIAAYGAFVAASQGNIKPTQMIVPLSSEQLLFKRLGTGTASNDTSIKKYLEDTLKLNITSDFLLEAAGGSASKRMVLAAPALDNMVLHIPRPQQWLAPQMSNLRVVVPSSYKYAGFEVRRVYTVRYTDAI